MEHQEHHFGVVKNYTFTALLSFSIMFCLFVLMSNCSGPYHPQSNHHAADTEKTQSTHH